MIDGNEDKMNEDEEASRRQRYGLYPSPSAIDSICVGSGRFLRSVLVPALNVAGLRPAIVQTRGRTFLESFLDDENDGDDLGGKGTKRDGADGEEKVDENGGENQRQNGDADDDDGDGDGDGALKYEVDTVEFDGETRTERVSCYGAGTLGSEGGMKEALSAISDMKTISVIGVGVTEAGLSSPSTKAMIDLTILLHRIETQMGLGKLKCPNPNGRVCIVNTDNVPHNGKAIRGHVLENAKKGVAGPQQAAEEEDGGKEEDTDKFVKFLNAKVAFLDSMVDRITSQREGSRGLIPRCEPVPSKALVIEDLNGDLPPPLSADIVRKERGVVVRTQNGQLDADVALKLRVANGTHTAAAQAMALCGMTMTDALSPPASSNYDSEGKVVMEYLDSLIATQIHPAATDDPSIKCNDDDVNAAWDDWRRRLTHPHFGLSTFFISQNCAAKGGIRLGPTIKSLLRGGNEPISASMAFALAMILRFLTPAAGGPNGPKGGAYRGWLDGADRSEAANSSPEGGEHARMYADGLRHDLSGGWYEFRCDCTVVDEDRASTVALPLLLGRLSSSSSSGPRQPSSYRSAVVAYLTSEEGGDLGEITPERGATSGFDDLADAVATLYARLVAGDSVPSLLREMRDEIGPYEDRGFAAPCSALSDAPRSRTGSNGKCNPRSPLFHRPNPIPDDSALLKVGIGMTEDEIAGVVFGEVASAEAVDLHTHLLPPSHGPLCLWGIDELLTYHYLVAEYFLTAPPTVSPESFYALTKSAQADLVWKALFLDRSPISEACRGVITTLVSLGLEGEVKSRDLDKIREFYAEYRDSGEKGAEDFSRRVYEGAGVRYAVMTNVPFDANEARCWRPRPKEYPPQYRSALRVDPLLAGDRKAVETALSGSGYETTLDGARKYLNDWIDTMKPEYVMASTPHDFAAQRTGQGAGGVKGNLANVTKTGLNEEALKSPGAFSKLADPSANCDATKCDGEDDGEASVVDENSDLLSDVLMKVCEERDLPVALKIGARRGVNPSLMQAGDGLTGSNRQSADGEVLGRLCARFPKVRFLATFLGRSSQHEACVLTSKFRNLHLYGCWWFCNNPSMIEEITSMRVEMLGTAFTAQHSDARVLDQLLYKWPHSRAVIAGVLAGEYAKLAESTWVCTRGEVRRDVRRLFGGSYEEFMKQSYK